jgi:hypothetical protein
VISISEGNDAERTCSERRKAKKPLPEPFSRIPLEERKTPPPPPFSTVPIDNPQGKQKIQQKKSKGTSNTQ